MNNTMTSNASGPGMPYSNLHNSKFLNPLEGYQYWVQLFGNDKLDTGCEVLNTHFKLMAHSVIGYFLPVCTIVIEWQLISFIFDIGNSNMNGSKNSIFGKDATSKFTNGIISKQYFVYIDR